MRMRGVDPNMEVEMRKGIEYIYGYLISRLQFM